MAEDQSAHRRGIESDVVKANIKNERVGMVFAFIIAMTVIVLGSLLVWQGRDTTGLALIIADVTALAGLFVYQKESNKRELAERRGQLSASASAQQ